MKKVAVIGHFGFGYDFFDGQTVKTKIIVEELRRCYGSEVVTVCDTHGGLKKVLILLWKLLGLVKMHENVIILPAQNGLRVIAMCLFGINKLMRRKLHYVVIGGWLPEFLCERKVLAYCLKSFDGIYVETYMMKKKLDALGFTNVFVMPNCKRLKRIDKSDVILTTNEKHFVCTFSRVMREKGIQEAVDAVTRINSEAGKVLFVLDIYGQVDKEQTVWFDAMQNHFPEYIHYKGIVPFDKSVEVLVHYDALLFPTYYDGEGFAGTVLDALASGVPIIASDWRYNSELIKSYSNGILVKCRDVDELVSGLKYLHENVEDWNRLKVNCLKESASYLPENVLKVLIDRMENREKK